MRKEFSVLRGIAKVNRTTHLPGWQCSVILPGELIVTDSLFEGNLPA